MGIYSLATCRPWSIRRPGANGANGVANDQAILQQHGPPCAHGRFQRGRQRTVQNVLQLLRRSRRWHPHQGRRCCLQGASRIMDRVQNQYGYHIDEATMAQAEGMKAMMTSFGEQIFNELIDSNHDGQATLMEIEMNSYCIFRASAKMMIQMMDRNRNGKLDKREMGMMDLDELLKNPEAAKVRAYVPDLDELVKKNKAHHSQGRHGSRQGVRRSRAGQSHAGRGQLDGQARVQLSYFPTLPIINSMTC